ncbi:MAG TPA: hypothetical protein VMW73_17260 [Spirochaetia bacterium]|nr:hypothetical protein [Spirochaetia bacterium]
MTESRKFLRVVLIVLTMFLALTALAGGSALFFGWNAPSTELLAGTIFRDYTVPGLMLFIVVGGSALASLILWLRKSRFSDIFAIASGIIIMCFEFGEVLIIGSPPGPAFVLQLFYFVLGSLMVIVTLGLQFFELLHEKKESHRGE